MKSEHVEKNTSTNKTLNDAKSIDPKIFDSFKTLTNDNNSERVNGGLLLLEHFIKTSTDDTNEKEIKYTLKRLVRGLGASTTASRAGFFATLVGFLKSTSVGDINPGKVLSVAKKELHVGGTIGTKEDADAIVGQILCCGALIRAQKIAQLTADDLTKCIGILIAASSHRTYHNALAYSFLVEFLQNITEDQFISTVWPPLEKELSKPWSKQTINSIHCLISSNNIFPNVVNAKHLKVHHGGIQILNANSAPYLYKFFWENSSISLVTHPALESFSKYIAQCKYLPTFWNTEIDPNLSSSSSKLREIITIKVLTDVLSHIDPNSIKISSLLTENFVKMLVTTMKGIKLKKDDTLKAFCEEFFESLYQCSAKIADENEKVEIIHKLILYPSVLGIEKYTHRRIVHQMIGNLGTDGIQKLFETYKDIFLGKTMKNPKDKTVTWLNVEKQNAAYMLQTLINQKNAQTAYEWRGEQLKLLMVMSFFHFNNDFKVVTKSEDCELIGNEFANQVKGMFYSCLQSKLPKLEDEKKILLSLVEFCNQIIQKKNPNKYLRTHIDDKILKIWNEMYKEVDKLKSKTSKSKDNKLHLVFHILLLHMGLQLFREPEMAEIAILDLEKSIEKIKEKHPKKKPIQIEGQIEEEPEWIEVIIDLFLHLLSQNDSSLRNVVNAVFPHLCENLTLTAIHQILSVLDMKDGKNPLSSKDDEEGLFENGNDDQTDSDDDSDSNDEDDDDMKSDKLSNEDDDDDDDDDDDEESLEEEEEEGTLTDKLKNAVSSALCANPLDTDQDSIDLNDLDEEEGNRLNAALENAFKLMKRPAESKKSKGYRVKTTTVMHFRIRVLDLIEIYIQRNPSLLIATEIMLGLYNMIEFCAEKDLEPLANKIERVLGKLTGLRQFISTEDINEQNICDYLRMILDKKVKAIAYNTHNKLKNKCCIFLIASCKLMNDPECSINDINKILNEYLNEFIKSRNPIINVTLLNDIFKMRWKGLWPLSVTLAKNGLTDTTRPFRRIQSLEILEHLYKNHELIRQNVQVAKKSLKIIEKCIEEHSSRLTNKPTISAKEFTTLLDILFAASRCHKKIPIDSNFDELNLCENVQKLRRKIKLENLHSYSRFCHMFKMKLIKNTEVVKTNGKLLTNGSIELELSSDAEDISGESNDRKVGKASNNEVNKPIQNGRKRKTTKNDGRKDKKLKKEVRMQTSSEGLNGGITFLGAPIDVDISDGSENGSSDEDSG